MDSAIGHGVLESLKGLAARFNILGIVTLVQGLFTMALSWMIFFRSETALLVANDAQIKLLIHVSQQKRARLAKINERISRLTGASAAVVDMLKEIDDVMGEYGEILTYCEHIAAKNAIERWWIAKNVSLRLAEREAKARDPTHTMNLILSGVFALLEIAGDGVPPPQSLKALVDI